MVIPCKSQLDNRPGWDLWSVSDRSTFCKRERNVKNCTWIVVYITIVSNLWNPFPSTPRSTSASIPAQIRTLRTNRSNTVIIRERFASRMCAVISVLLDHHISYHNILLTYTYAWHTRVTGPHCWSLPYRDICTMHIFYIRCYNLFYKCVMNV